MTIADIDRAITRLSPSTRELERLVSSSLVPFCSKFGFPFLSRIKQESSICQKIETGRYRKLIDIDDLVAFTIIVPTSAYEPRCVQFIQEMFSVINIKTKAQSVNSPKSFTFDSTRVYAKCRCPEWEDDKNRLIYKIIFEVQIQTALEHAWITATHDIVYKSNTVDWQKVRLAAQIKAQVETIDQIFNNFEKFAISIEMLSWREAEQTSKLIQFFEKMCDVGALPPEKLPFDRIRLGENAVKLLSKKSLANLDETLDAVGNEFENISKEGFPQNLTLIQVFMLAAIRSDKQVTPQDKFTPHITLAFSRMFTEVQSWGREFSYDLS